MTTPQSTADPNLADVPRLSLRAPQAAKALGIGERLLWTLTNQGAIPFVRLGPKTIVYPVKALTQWLAEQAKGDER